MKKVLVFLILILISINIFSCGENNTSSVSSIGVSDLYKTALGRLYNTRSDEFGKEINVCDLSLIYYENKNNLVLTLNNCQERLMMVDLLLVDEELLRNSDEEAIINGEETIFPYLGLEFSEDYIVVDPNDEEAVSELTLTYLTKDLSSYLVLFSYFEDSEGFSRRVEHYLKFTSDEVNRIGDSIET